MLKRIVLYVFPLYLIGVEYIIRYILSHYPGKKEDLAFVSFASTLIAAGLVLTAAAVIRKPLKLEPPLAKSLQDNGYVATYRNDDRLIPCAWAALLVLPIVWGFTLLLVHQANTTYDPTVLGVTFPLPWLLAIAVYFIGIMFTELKERA